MIPWMDALRIDQEDIGIRKAYHTLLFNDFDLPVGRDQFEAYFIEKGYQLTSKPVFKPETTKRGAYYSPNLVADLAVTNINQVYLSDSSYWWIAPRWVYFTTLMDVYSRHLLGLICSEGLSAEETVIPAINAAILSRGHINLSGCFMHSDKGGQYIDGNFRDILEQQGMISSMASNVYENPHIESVNQSIKRFLRAKEIKTYSSFVAACANLQQTYNHKRLHDGLLPYRQTPVSYEALIATLNPEDRPVLILPPMCNKY